MKDLGISNVTGTTATYMRFLPDIKKNYDYGVVIFLLTFNLITVSSYRVDNVLKIAYDRFYTIAIGCGICLVMSLLVFPNWSGEELHNSNVSKLEGLAMSIEGMCIYTIYQLDTMYTLFNFQLRVHLHGLFLTTKSKVKTKTNSLEITCKYILNEMITCAI